MFIIHVDLNSMTITSIESSTLLPINTVHCSTSELFILWSGGFLLFFSLYFLFSQCNFYFGEMRRIYSGVECRFLIQAYLSESEIKS